VTVFLCQNGVLPARRSPRSAPLERLVAAGVEVVADDLSLRERGVDPGRLIAGVRTAPIDTVVDALEAGRKVLWC
jgi:hypothetical protein